MCKTRKSVQEKVNAKKKINKPDFIWSSMYLGNLKQFERQIFWFIEQRVGGQYVYWSMFRIEDERIDCKHIFRKR